LTPVVKKARNIDTANYLEERMIKKINIFLWFLFLVYSPSVQVVHAQDAAKPASKGPFEKVYSLPYDQVWDKIVEVLTEKGLSEHPHGKMTANKDAGKITTPTFRYFKIFSAKPVKESHYRDTYTITITEAASFKAKEAKKKAEEAQFLLDEAKTKMEETKGKSGDEAKTLLEEAKQSEKDGKEAAEAAKKLEEEAKALASKPRVVKVLVERKFEIHDDTKRAWVDADPNVEKTGLSGDALLSALDAKLTAPTTAASGDAKPAAKEETKK
jgi:hypothetical protein